MLNLDSCKTCMDVKIKQTTVTPDLVAHSNTARIYVKSTNKEAERSSQRLHAYLMGGAHEDVVGDFSKHQSQVDDIILGAAAFRKVADVNNTACCGFSGWKWLQMIMRKKRVTVRPS